MGAIKVYEVHRFRQLTLSIVKQQRVSINSLFPRIYCIENPALGTFCILQTVMRLWPKHLRLIVGYVQSFCKLVLLITPLRLYQFFFCFSWFYWRQS